MDCINWTGYVAKNGYGNNGGTPAHRKAWIRANGPIADGLVVMHKCANKLCVNLEHLELGTQHDNRMEQVTRGANPKQKIDWDEAQLIRWCGLQGGKKYGWATTVARIFGVDKSTISAIRNRKTFTEAG